MSELKNVDFGNLNDKLTEIGKTTGYLKNSQKLLDDYTQKVLDLYQTINETKLHRGFKPKRIEVLELRNSKNERYINIRMEGMEFILSGTKSGVSFKKGLCRYANRVASVAEKLKILNTLAGVGLEYANILMPPLTEAQEKLSAVKAFNKQYS